MGGRDLLDSLLSLYRIQIRSKKWYHKLFFHFLDVTVVQSWLVYCRSIIANEGKLKLREFKMILANSLMRAGKSTSTKRGRPSLADVEKQLQAKKKTWSSSSSSNRSYSIGWSRSLASLYGKWQRREM